MGLTFRLRYQSPVAPSHANGSWQATFWTHTHCDTLRAQGAAELYEQTYGPTLPCTAQGCRSEPVPYLHSTLILMGLDQLDGTVRRQET